jgi:hypothetical protein
LAASLHALANSSANLIDVERPNHMRVPWL